MKAVILAGGKGTRLSEETTIRPKPMVEVGGQPLLWHIMKIYGAHGINDFIICLGYKGYVIKEYFANYFLHTSDVTMDLRENRIDVHHRHAEPWRVTLVDTGMETMTGGRLGRVREYLESESTFCLTYGDGVSDVDISRVIQFHCSRGEVTLATVTAVRPVGRFGVLELEGATVKDFREKPQGEGAWINIGFFVLDRRVLEYIKRDEDVLERDVLRQLAVERKLAAYKHEGFWHPMDTLRDKIALEGMWDSGNAPWWRP